MRKNNGYICKLCKAILASLCLLISAVTYATPQVVRVDGAIYDSAGLPVSGTHSIVVKAYNAASGGTLLWTSATYGSVALGAGGRFTINLDATTGSPSLVQQMAAAAAASGVYFEITYDTNIVNPRIRARGSMFALSAGSLSGVTSSAAEINYLMGATANIQTQLNAAGASTGKVSKSGDSMSGALQVGALLSAVSVNVSSLTASKLLLTDATKNLVSSTSAVTDTQLGYLSPVTGDIQAQLNAKQSTLTTGAFATSTPALTVTGGAGAVIGTGVTVAISTATTSTTGLLTSTDWNTFSSTATNKVAKGGDTMTGPLMHPAGTAGAPAINFGDADAGFYRSSAGEVAVATAGIQRVKVSTAGMVVTGQVTSGQNTVASGAVVDFNTGNAQILAAPGQAAITLNNMQDGGSYTVVITEATSRQYTFTNCTNSKFVPANAPTTVSTTTVYSILKMTISAATYCYISWISGF